MSTASGVMHWIRFHYAKGWRETSSGARGREDRWKPVVFCLRPELARNAAYGAGSAPALRLSDLELWAWIHLAGGGRENLRSARRAAVNRAAGSARASLRSIRSISSRESDLFVRISLRSACGQSTCTPSSSIGRAKGSHSAATKQMTLQICSGACSSSRATRTACACFASLGGFDTSPRTTVAARR
jgi:hypothetical protein